MEKITQPASISHVHVCEHGFQGVGESLLTSLFTFILISIRPQRRHGRIYELNSKAEKADELKQFVQFLAVLKAILKEISAI